MRKYLRLRFLLLIIILIPLILLVKNFFFKSEIKEEIKEKSFPKKTSPSLIENKEILKRGITLTNILKKYKFSNYEIYKLISDIKPLYDLEKIKAGNVIKIFTLKNGKFNSLEYAINEENFLRVWKENNSYKGEIKKFPFQKKIVIIKGIIEDNLLNAINRLNEKDKLGLELAEIFGWDIDFYTDLRKGDEFILIFEKNYLEGKFFKYGNILAAKFKNKGKEFIAIRYVYPDTNEADYFAPDGKSIRKEFLKSPLKYGRITSRFNYRRFHPIFKKYTPHYGVDYSAPIGTPVQATADGVITFIGRKKGSGKIIKIRHKNTYESFYLHLSRFRKGLKKGIKVKQGDIIGYVGSTGLSIGPHLDYRVKFRGKYINPLRWKFKTAKPVRKEYLNDFLKKSFKYIRLLEKLSTENKQINRMLERNGLSS